MKDVPRWCARFVFGIFVGLVDINQIIGFINFKLTIMRLDSFVSKLINLLSIKEIGVI